MVARQPNAVNLSRRMSSPTTEIYCVYAVRVTRCVPRVSIYQHNLVRHKIIVFNNPAARTGPIYRAPVTPYRFIFRVYGKYLTAARTLLSAAAWLAIDIIVDFTPG